MLLSMTGFSIKTITLVNKDGSRAHLTLSLKSLNARFFEATCKLPFALNYLETDCIKKIKEHLIRGYVVFSIQMSNPNIFKGPVEPDLGMTKSYLDALKTLQKTYNLEGSLTLRDLILLPNIFSSEEKTLEEDIKYRIFEALDELINSLLKTREQEGQALFSDLQKRHQVITHELRLVQERAHQFMQERKKEIVERLTHIDQQNQELAESQRNLLYFELDKIDIHEEIVRFINHLKTFEHHLNSQELEKGRRLDFILQELAREINTITAKCSDSIISSHAINIKVELEKAREQVQNVV